MNSLPIRPGLLGKEPYGAPQLDTPIKLNTNENPFPHEENFVAAATAALAETIRTANRYPDRDAIKLRNLLAGYVTDSTGLKIGIDQVWAANGSNEILLQLFQLFGGPNRTAIGFEPSYSMHPIIAGITHTNWVSLNRDSNYDIMLPSSNNEISEANLVLICTPNNPTGNATDLDLISKLHQMTSGMVVVDEAYAEFAAGKSAISLLETHPRLAVVRTMSKAFGFAGVRLGYLVGSAELVEAIQLVRLPYHLSSITQETACLALTKAAELKPQIEFLIRERERISNKINNLGLKVVPSEANFILFGGINDSRKLWEYLVDHGVLVRDVGISGWLRVTCGTEAENTSFLDKLESYLVLNKSMEE